MKVHVRALACLPDYLRLVQSMPGEIWPPVMSPTAPIGCPRTSIIKQSRSFHLLSDNCLARITMVAFTASDA